MRALLLIITIASTAGAEVTSAAGKIAPDTTNPAVVVATAGWTRTGSAVHQSTLTDKVGIGIVVPTARLEIVPGADDKFVIKISSQNGNMRWAYSAQYGHIDISGIDPTLGTCTNGTLDTVSSDSAGRVVFADSNSTCTVSWAFPHNGTPNCMCTAFNAGKIGCEIIARSSTSVTFAPQSSAWASGDAIDYQCVDMHAE